MARWKGKMPLVVPIRCSAHTIAATLDEKFGIGKELGTKSMI